MISAKQIEDYESNGFLVLDSELADFQIEEIKSEILSSLAEIELRKADDPLWLSMEVAITKPMEIESRC